MNSRIITLSLALGLLGGVTELSALPQKPTRKVQTSRPAASKLQQDFLAKQKAFPKGDFFRIFKQQMTPEERDAMTFLYAYMPTNDLIDRDGDSRMSAPHYALARSSLGGSPSLSVSGSTLSSRSVSIMRRLMPHAWYSLML